MDILHRIALAVVPPLYVGLSRLLFATCRLTIREEHYCRMGRVQRNPSLRRSGIKIGIGFALFTHLQMNY
jgi:hypothetical protein